VGEEGFLVCPDRYLSYLDKEEVRRKKRCREIRGTQLECFARTILLLISLKIIELEIKSVQSVVWSWETGEIGIIKKYML